MQNFQQITHRPIIDNYRFDYKEISFQVIADNLNMTALGFILKSLSAFYVRPLYDILRSIDDRRTKTTAIGSEFQ